MLPTNVFEIGRLRWHIVLVASSGSWIFQFVKSHEWLCCWGVCIHEEHLYKEKYIKSQGMHYASNTVSNQLDIYEQVCRYSLTIKLLIGFFNNGIIRSLYLPVTIFHPWLAIRMFNKLSILVQTSWSSFKKSKYQSRYIIQAEANTNASQLSAVPQSPN